MIHSASNHLNNNKVEVDTLNVFPVPDGDTGTNMSLTFTAAATEVKKFVTSSIEEVGKALASASLRGARGNSCVILSQLCRGISKSVAGKQSVDAVGFAAALQNGVETAYKAVMRPTEGTILTVARMTAAAAVEAAKTETDIEKVFAIAIEAGKEALANTPNQLPVLKEAGVVDAGGAGLVYLLEGAYTALTTGTIVELQGGESAPAATATSAQASLNVEDIKFGYCTEFIIDKKNPDVDVAHFSEVIDPKGDCKLVIDDDEIVKVHIHTNHPGFVIEEALKLGALSKIKIDNMRLQHSSIIEAEQADTAPAAAKEEKPRKPYGFVAVTAGAGLADIFRDYGADEIIEGGQTMNPSTDDILTAVEKINADCIFVLPNNKNIILAAEQAAELSETKVVVLPTKTVPQGYSAMMAFLPHLDVETNTAAMKEAIGTVKTAQVTYAVRDTSVSGKTIAEGDIIGICEGEITTVGDKPAKVCRELVKGMVDEDSSVISVFYGSDVTDEEAEKLAEKLEEKYPDMDVMLQSGQQPLYYYIISVE
ncbi:MAG: DAK2 domain-containing protein [Clostridia bacterium]|nr:DAK2 domain-containing protein [Clostridia bacterium]